ncbi:hypothetical protein BN1708_009082 [Verticillium longisporum]|uniref:Zn(2)-C6 fungal-type domain-containing protein n=1 Tax=Verticillium longisporum TaxID=100787 RepID=A0A0G4KDG9_VERLO|nr:hypothetical protein BN1708_009082 [Verticillium longisporum]
MRQTLRRSCAACARSKHSCDLRTPRCSRCLKRNVQCLYANEPLTASSVSSEQPGREEAWALTTYRFGSLDPFDSYPQTRLPRAQVQRLIHSFHNKIAFQYYPLDLSATSNPFLVSWWPLALGDPALFHVSLQTACLDEELLAQKGFQSSEVLMADSVALLRRKVEDLSLAVQDGTMNSVITLATIEYGKSNIEVSHTHVEGVKRLVQLRGGINAVRQTSPLTARMVSWASMLIMGHPQFETQDDAGIGDGIPPIPEWQLEPIGLDDYHVDLAPYEIDYAVSNVVGRLRSVFRQAEQVHFSTTRLHDLTCFVVHRLLRASPDPSISAPSPMSQCLRYATALYMFIIQGPTYYPHTVIMSDVIRNLIENHDQLDPSPFDIWIFTIGLAASVGTAQYQWFLERARAAATSLQLREWGHSGAKGRKFQQCLTCLQESPYETASESDQMWFLYNLRYTLGHCIFGFPNSTGIGSGPCLTSSACGPLEDALTDNLSELDSTSQYGYCDADGGAMTSDAFGRCLDCVKVGGEHHLLSNFLVALDAGCQQRPNPGTLIGLNDTIFSATAIEAVDPSTLETKKPEQASVLTLPAIVGIAVGGFVLLLLASGCGYMHHRKRKARRESQNMSKKGARRHRPASSLSFRCQTHLTPRSPSFFPIGKEETATREKPFVDPAAALNSNPSISTNMSSAWNQSSASLPPTQPWRGKAPPQGHAKDALSLSTILPSHAQSSFYKPSPTDYTTPTSTTSTRSTTALLPVHHAPRTASYGASAPPRPPRSPATESYGSPLLSGATASPLLSQRGWPPQPVQPRSDAVSSSSPRQSHPQGQVLNILLGRETIAPVAQKRGVPVPALLGGGSPTESRTLQTSFPPPPSPKRR